MDALIFKVCNLIALVSWILLIGFPRARITRLVVFQLGAPLLLAASYLALIVTTFGAFKAGGGFGSLEQVQTLFTFPRAVLAGWLHYLAFDLFVGSRIARDSQRQGIAAYAVAPALILTFMFGPVGMLTYAVQRRLMGRAPDKTVSRSA
jgi:hypothetical protein